MDEGRAAIRREGAAWFAAWREHMARRSEEREARRAAAWREALGTGQEQAEAGSVSEQEQERQ